MRFIWSRYFASISSLSFFIRASLSMPLSGAAGGGGFLLAPLSSFGLAGKKLSSVFTPKARPAGRPDPFRKSTSHAGGGSDVPAGRAPEAQLMSGRSRSAPDSTGQFLSSASRTPSSFPTATSGPGFGGLAALGTAPSSGSRWIFSVTSAKSALSGSLAACSKARIAFWVGENCAHRSVSILRESRMPWCVPGFSGGTTGFTDCTVSRSIASSLWSLSLAISSRRGCRRLTSNSRSSSSSHSSFILFTSLRLKIRASSSSSATPSRACARCFILSSSIMRFVSSARMVSCLWPTRSASSSLMSLSQSSSRRLRSVSDSRRWT
mmetsp:Transcript_19540/g.58587  ORF Transcript_19540/g.58587 Transcript_19540/m.58587 type:complete len:322 (+) Transcript_19540:835-1800(+)